MSEETAYWRNPHTHTEDDVRRAGGKDGCPVCLRLQLVDMTQANEGNAAGALGYRKSLEAAEAKVAAVEKERDAATDLANTTIRILTGQRDEERDKVAALTKERDEARECARQHEDTAHNWRTVAERKENGVRAALDGLEQFKRQYHEGAEAMEKENAALAAKVKELEDRESFRSPIGASDLEITKYVSAASSREKALADRVAQMESVLASAPLPRVEMLLALNEWEHRYDLWRNGAEYNRALSRLADAPEKPCINCGQRKDRHESGTMFCDISIWNGPRSTRYASVESDSHNRDGDKS